MDLSLARPSLANEMLSTLVDVLSFRAQNQPDKIAYSFLDNGETDDKQLTYRQLDIFARHIATELQDRYPVGSRALLLYPSGLDFISAFFGCLYAGLVAVPAYPPRRNQKMARLESIIRDCEASVVLSTSSTLSIIETRFSDHSLLATLTCIATDNGSIDPLQSNWKKPDIDSDTLAFLQYTSGSTGNPKGVMVSHRNVLCNEQMIESAYNHSDQTIGVGWLPLFHDMGLIGNVLQPLYIGFPIYAMSPEAFLQKPLRWLQAISRYHATSSGGPNFAYDLCTKKITDEQIMDLDLTSWKVAFSGAEPIRVDTLQMFAEKFKPCGFSYDAFYPNYGMAETTLFVTGGLTSEAPVIRELDAESLEKNLVVAATNSQQIVRKVVGCGRTWLDEKILIVDPKTLIQCEENQVGEIWVTGAHVAQGYWNNPEETKQVFQAYLSDTGEGPFLRTGDLGFLQDGELFVTGRYKDLIIVRGQNYYPQDIELTVENAHPALRSSSGAAFTVEVKGLERLVVVNEVERSYLRKLDVDDVVRSIRMAVTAEYNLQVYAALLLKPASIPKTSSGKIRRSACRFGFLNCSLDLVGDWSESPEAKSEFMNLKADIESVLGKLSESS